MENLNNDYVIKHYRCKVCNATHEVKLKKDLAKGRPRYPFPYITMHSEVVNNDLKEFLIMLYIDKDLQIRGMENLSGNEDFYTKEQMKEITGKLMQEIEFLREENLALMQQIHELRAKLKEK